MQSQRLEPIRVLVADDQALVRGGIVLLLMSQPDIEVIAETADGADTLVQARMLLPDVVIMDLQMPGVDGIEATRLLAHNPPDQDRLTKILVLTTFNDDDSVYGALRAGASGFLIKHQAPAHLVEAVRAVAVGDSWIDSTIAARVLHTLASYPQAGRPGQFSADPTDRPRARGAGVNGIGDEQRRNHRAVRPQRGDGSCTHLKDSDEDRLARPHTGCRAYRNEEPQHHANCPTRQIQVVPSDPKAITDGL